MAISTTYTSPSVRITPVPPSLLRFPPEPLPSTVPPPSGEATLAHPFAIPPHIYNRLLSAEVPITVALGYATIVTLLNYANTKRDYKPWAISQTRAFRAFVIAHNIFLALFSAGVFIGLINALRVSLDGAAAEHGFVGVVDALCKINGPRGLGDAATFNASTGAWGFTNRALKLAADSLPDTTDIGRIWNEGLSFYGWLFYLSKFYEVVDTLIILAKGKKSSFLQTYHHAGVMICMWAGIRYMAPPIWMFVLVNSFIHVLMYTYYTATALGVRVPKVIKQTITTMQIAQIVVGTTFAFAHLFISYTIPTSVPYVYSLAELTSAISSDISSAASVATASASAGLGSWLKKLAFRAAGEEGLAENVRNEQGKPFGTDALHAAKDLKAREEIRYRDELRMIHCTDTSGQVFAILINCFYLLPLTAMFVRFFIRSYTKKGEEHKGQKSSKLHLLEESGRDAVKEVTRELQQALDGELRSMQDENGTKASSAKDKARGSTDKQASGDEGKRHADSNEPKQNEDRTESSGQNSGSGEGRDETLKTEDDKDKDSKMEDDKDQGAKTENDKNQGARTENDKDQDAKTENDKNQGARTENDRDGGSGMKDDKDDDFDAEQDDVEILDSAEAVKDVLAEGIETADKFSKNLENSKAG